MIKAPLWEMPISVLPSRDNTAGTLLILFFIVFLSLFKAHHCLALLFGEEPTTVAGGLRTN
jgi:hypothetical protein